METVNHYSRFLYHQPGLAYNPNRETQRQDLFKSIPATILTVDPANRDITGSNFDQPTIVSADDFFDDLFFKIALFAIVWQKLLRLQNFHF